MTKKIRPIHQPQLGHLSRRPIFDFCQWLFPRDTELVDHPKFTPKNDHLTIQVIIPKPPFSSKFPPFSSKFPAFSTKFPAFSSLGPGGRERAARRGARAPGEREPAEPAEPGCRWRGGNGRHWDLRWVSRWAKNWPATSEVFSGEGGTSDTDGFSSVWLLISDLFKGDSWKCWRIQWLNSCFLELHTTF